MKITLDTLTQWNACSRGKETFVARFPDGAEYKEVIAACDADGHSDYRNWIFTHAFQHTEAKEIVEAETDLIPAELEKGLEGSDLKEDDTASKEVNSQLAASGDYSQLAASGENSIIASAGAGSAFKLGDGGCAAIPYRDENDKTRFAVAYVGENVEANTWYRVNENGEFLKIEEQES